jgi:hypothetical protein
MTMLKPGTRVRVKSGPTAGTLGTVARRKLRNGKMAVTDDRGRIFVFLDGASIIMPAEPDTIERALPTTLQRPRGRPKR